MVLPAPPVDKRTPAEVAEQARQLLCHYLGRAGYGWHPGDDGGEAGRALVGVFAHYCGLVIDRINRAPEKNFLAFLDLLGNALTPPQPARVPLSFALDAVAPQGCAVDAGTQVQAEVEGGSGEPPVFETERELWVSNFELQALALVPLDGPTDIDISQLIGHPAANFNRPLQPKSLFDRVETFYLGMQLVDGRLLAPQRPLTIFFFVDDTTYDPRVPGADAASASRVVWEYSAETNPRKWSGVAVQDSTRGLTESGSLELLVPDDFVPVQRRTFEKKMYWLRAHLVDTPGGVYAQPPRLYGVALNTVQALQAVTVRDDVLGSSDGNAGQVFTAFRKPVLPGQLLEVREQQATAAAPGAGAGPAETWVPWTQVDDFYASESRDRHYVLNRQTGEVLFGDGSRGMIPPPGVRNLRLASYRTGGGRAGNVAAGALKTLLAGNRQVAKVGNLVAAQGGADSEAADSLLERAPRALRHRGRAVTDEDLEDLAKLASTEVARALCVPLIDLSQTPSKFIATTDDEVAGAGLMSVVVVPRSTAEKPLPSQQLMRHVRERLLQRSTATALLSVVGPLYLRIDVKLEVVLTSMRFEERVRRELQALFTGYLHPLTGRGGAGWTFGREPKASDFHRLLAGVEGIHHVSALSVTAWAEETPFDYTGTEPLRCIQDTKRFLVCSGRHQIGVTAPG